MRMIGRHVYVKTVAHCSIYCDCRGESTKRALKTRERRQWRRESEAEVHEAPPS